MRKDKYDAFSRGFENTEEMIPEIKIVFGDNLDAVAPRAAMADAGSSFNIAGNTISLATAKAGYVSVDVYGMNGRHTATLFNGTLAQGSYAFSLENMPKGMYIVRVKGTGITATQPALVK